MDESKKKALDAAMSKLDKQFGKGSIMRMSDKPEMEIEAISTGSLNLDIALGVGGLPRGRIIELYGPESCIRGDAFVRYEVRDKKGNRMNHKGGTIEHLYERFHNICQDGRANKIDYENVDFYVPAINEEDCVVQQKIIDVIRMGVKPCYKLTTQNGNEIVATGDHEFYVGNGEYVRLDRLSVGDCVYIHNNTRFTKESERKPYHETLVKYHPSNRPKIVNGYTYYRVKQACLVYEAYLNNMEVDEYRNVLNTKPKEFIDTLQYVDSEKYDIHHKDFNPGNNDISNLEMLEKSEHYRKHALLNQKNMSFVVVQEKIKSIKQCGEYEVYDIKCSDPYHNFIANGIVVHNCGKSTLAMHCVAEVQKAGGTACYIDAEHAMDPTYAASVGVNVDELLIAQPSSGEEGLEICDTMVRSGVCDIIIVDSVAALVPKAELDGEMGDAVVGLQARLMSQAMRKLTASISQSKCIVVFINQIRMKIGVMYGNPETVCGGNALKFYSTIRMDIRRVEAIKKGTEIIGNHVRVKVVKNKVAPPFREAEFDIIFGEGISKDGEIVDAAIKLEIINKGGAWFSYKNEETGREERWQGREKVKEALANDEELKAEIEALVVSQLSKSKH